MHIKIRYLLLIICILVLSFTLSGCYDLGEGTEDDDDYRNIYSDISVINDTSSKTYYTMEDFYNKEAVNDFKSPMEEDKRDYYTYLIIKVEKDLSLGQIAVHFDSTNEDTLSVSFFILDEDEVPSKVYSGAGGAYPLDECDEPDMSKSLGKATCTLSGGAGKWKAIYLKSWTSGESTTKRHSISEGQFLVMRIDNNCYDPAKARLEEAEKKWNELVVKFQEKLNEWQDKNNDSSASQAEKDAAMNALSEATAEKNLGERDYQEAQDYYAKNKFPYGKMSVRITAILINAK